ncbi:MAG TPA: energy transducer TonB [Bacteroidales bacterium]|nr:energy transducer TonB [Bacteroidales bacterium]HQQ12037.1 energy transducer TonB [Bacteroidales bacterium]
MEVKKSPKADLENKRTIFMQVGLVLALAVVFLAFEYKSYDKRTLDIAQRVVEDIPEEIVPITDQTVKPPPPPPAAQVTVLQIVEDDVEVADIEINADVDLKEAIEVYVPPVREEEEVVETEIFTVVESMPEFPGGAEQMMGFIAKNIKYPPMARESGIQGRVFVNFVVEPDGRVSNVKVLRGIGGGCDEEAIRVVESMPKWTPGRQRGKAVRVSFNLPVRFTLQ